MQTHLEGSVSPNSGSRSIWANGYNFGACQAKTALNLAANKASVEPRKSVCVITTALNPVVFASLLFRHPNHTASRLPSLSTDLRFLFHSTKPVPCWTDTILRAHTKPRHHWRFHLKQKEVTVATTVTELSQRLQDVNSEGFLAVVAQNAYLHISLSCKPAYAAALEITWHHTMPLAGIPRPLHKKQGGSFSDCIKEIIIKYNKN